MSHHFQLPPEIDLAIRSWIRLHKRALQLGCFGSILMAFLLLRTARTGRCVPQHSSHATRTDRAPRAEKGRARQPRVQVFCGRVQGPPGKASHDPIMVR